MSCPTVTTIQATECVGNSLATINANFNTLAAAECDNQSQIAALLATLAVIGIPAGAIQAFVQQTQPTGWLLANGVVVPNGTGTVQGITANFSSLYAIVGTSFGVAGTIPDLRGYFVRGYGTNSDGTSSGTFGALQTDTLASHTHGVIDPGHAHSLSPNAWGGGSAFSVSNQAGYNVQNIPATNAATTGVSIASTGDVETRPSNIALLYCIKY
jgi:microcystin-dependent protein